MISVDANNADMELLYDPGTDRNFRVRVNICQFPALPRHHHLNFLHGVKLYIDLGFLLSTNKINISDSFLCKF